MGVFIDNYRRYSEHATIWDMFKVIALISMVFGHIGSYFVPDEQWYRMIGRVCVPIWFLLAGYGYRPHQRNVKELFLLGCALVVVDFIFNDPLLPLNILFTHLAGRFFLSRIAGYDRDAITLCILMLILLVLWLPSNVMFEYGTEVFFFMLAGFYAAEGNKKIALWTLILSTCIYLPSQIFAFRFEMHQEATMVIMLVLLTVAALYWHGIKHDNFKKPLPSWGIINNGIKFLARNTLAFYVLHVAFFVMAVWIFDPAQKPIMTIENFIK